MDDLEKLLKSAKMRKNKKLLQDIGDVLRLYENKQKRINHKGKTATKVRQVSTLKKMR